MFNLRGPCVLPASVHHKSSRPCCIACSFERVSTRAHVDKLLLGCRADQGAHRRPAAQHCEGPGGHGPHLHQGAQPLLKVLMYTVTDCPCFAHSCHCCLWALSSKQAAERICAQVHYWRACAG